MLSGQIALICAAVFAGAAVYINFAEHPARLGLDEGPLLKQWQPSYKRGFTMQASLAVIGGLFGLYTWYVINDWRWALGAIVLMSNWPFTLWKIMPVNNQLMAMSPETPGENMREMMEQWGTLHGVRSALGCAATLIFLWALN